MTRPGRAVVEKAIREAGGNLAKTARILGCTRQSLYTWCYQLGLDRLAGIESREALLARSAARKAEDARRPRRVPLPGMTVATMRLPGDSWRWARIQAINTDRTAAAIVAEALELLRAVVEHEQ